MSQIAPAKTLDLKSLKTDSSPKKKSKDDSFRKELNEREKKTSDRDHLSAAHHSNVERREASRKTAEDSKTALRSKSNETKAKNINAPTRESAAPKDTREEAAHPAETEVAAKTALDTKTAAPAATPGAVAPGDGPVKPAIAETVAQAIELQGEQLESFQNMLAGQVVAQEGISLEGMTPVQPQAVQLQAAPVATVEAPSATITQEISAAMSALAGQEGQSFQSDSDSAEGSLGDLKSDQMQDMLSTAAQAQAKQKDGQFETALKAATAGSAAATEGAREANVDNLVQSARTLLRNGGGEMQIILNPEGLGAIDLKVAVKGNEVNIEIIAQDQNVKKMFEDGMHDIRGALELQNLKIENFKVDLSQRSESQQFADQQTQQENANREFARDFMNQFRGERHGMRQASMGYDMERSPNFSKSPEGLSPAQKVNANGRLNIVA